MPGRTTIVQVAKRLGVSPSTVSRAFNEPHKLLPATVERVHQVAEEMGYIPNRHARALITGRSGIIGLSVPDITNPFFPPMIRVAQRLAEQRKLNVFVVETNNDPDRERRLIATLLPQVEGLIIASPRLGDEELRSVAAEARLVLVNSDVSGTARVLIASSAPLARALHDLAGHGVRRICYVGGPRRSWSEAERSGTVQRVGAELGLETFAMQVETGTYADARRLAAQVAATRPDAVIAFDDVIAHGVMHGLESLDVHVPADIKLLGCDDALPSQTRPQLSTIRLRAQEGIKLAIELLDDPSSPLPETRLEVQGELIHRETT